MMKSTRLGAIAVATVAAGSFLAAGAASAAPSGSSGFTADLVGTPVKEPFQCGLKVTNNGPATARDVVVVQPGFGVQRFPLGDIAAGESKTTLQIDCGIYAFGVTQYAVSSTLDPNPFNNGGRVFS